jgi:hypothetical protein
MCHFDHLFPQQEQQFVDDVTELLDQFYRAAFGLLGKTIADRNHEGNIAIEPKYHFFHLI